MKQENLTKMIGSFKNKMIRQGYDVKDSAYQGGLYGVYQNDTLLMTVMEKGVLGREVNAGLEDLTEEISKEFSDMKEAHAVYENATSLPYQSITDYRLISSYGDALLAAKMTKSDEIHFTTWSYDYDHTGVLAGHYYETNYESAKQDFAIRAGLIDKEKLFDKDQLASIYDACVYRGVNDGEITYDDEKLLRDVLEKVEANLPEAIHQEHIRENELELEQ
ncbi:MAG: hypothetical protein R3Y47_12790 [Lachnospiraceae bacterium]